MKEVIIVFILVKSSYSDINLIVLVIISIIAIDVIIFKIILIIVLCIFELPKCFCDAADSPECQGPRHLGTLGRYNIMSVLVFGS